MPITIRQSISQNFSNEGVFFLYRHIRLDTNQVFYIGIGKKPKHRPITGIGVEYSRAYVKSNRGRQWKNIVAKSGYKVDILFESNDHETIKQKEIEFITLYGRRDLCLGSLVNYTNGGDGVPGRIVSEETKKKISIGHIGKIYTEERKKLCKTNTTTWCNSMKIKMGVINSNRNKSNTGKCREVFQYTLDKKFIKKWPSTMQIERETGFYHSRIVEACNSNNHKFNNYIWTYVNIN